MTSPATDSATPQDGTAAVAAPAAPQTPAQGEEQRQSQTQLAIGSLPDHIKQGLILNRQRNIVAGAIAEANWGRGLDKETRFRISEWGTAAGLDVATELDVLGGRFYKNAQYYLRKLSEMIERGLVEYAFADHVEVDERLEKRARRQDNPTLAAEARTEADRRERCRIEYNIPDAAVSSVIWRVKLVGVAVEFTAAKWCGGGTRKKDPVGDDFPVETSETRAARRCMRLIASQNPAFKPYVETNDDDTIDAEIGGALREGLLKAKEAKSLERARGVNALSALGAGDGYGEETPATATPETVARAASMPSAYDEPKTSSPAPSGAPVVTVPAPESVSPKQNPAADTKQQAAFDDFDELTLLSPKERADLEEKKRLGRK